MNINDYPEGKWQWQTELVPGGCQVQLELGGITVHVCENG